MCVAVLGGAAITATTSPVHIFAAAGTLTVTPWSSLPADGVTTVVVAGTGMPPAAQIQLQQCSSILLQSFCAYLADVVADATGSFTVEVGVSYDMLGLVAQLGWPTCDWGGTEVTCVVQGVYQTGGIGSAGSTRLTFAGHEGPLTHVLTVATVGSGVGLVTTESAPILCGAGWTVCTADVADGAEVPLRAVPQGSSTFAGWSGDCSGTGPCVVTMDAAKTVTARFDRSVPSGGFVTSAGTKLILDGHPYQFTGLNFYQANNSGLCATPVSDGQLDGALDAIGAGGVLRAWFFQSLATTATDTRDWTRFDNTLAKAAARGIKVIPTLINQLKDCDGPNGGAGEFKFAPWYTSGYQTRVMPGSTVPYRDWVAEIVSRYKNDPTILAWQLINEAEVLDPPVAPTAEVPNPQPTCVAAGAQQLYDFAANVSALVKSIDSNHLLSLGTIGTGQCGASFEEYKTLHALADIDLCEFHDYGYASTVLQGDKYNGLAIRLRQCRALGKPLFIGESGIDPRDVSPSTLAARAAVFDAKINGELQAGVVGLLAWSWEPGGSQLDNFEIGPDDPVLTELRKARDSDGGDDDGDGVVNSIDVGAGMFLDTTGTAGVITDTDSMNVVVLDAFDPALGVRVSVAPDSPPRPLRSGAIAMCGATVSVFEGTEADLTCGSIHVAVDSGRVDVHVSPSRSVTIGAHSAATVEFFANGNFTVSNVRGDNVVVTINGAATPLPAGSSKFFPAWVFTGFSSPVSKSPNTVNSGQNVPLKWRLVDSVGKPVTTLSVATVSVSTLACSTGTTADLPAQTYTLTTGLKSLGNGNYQIDWKTPKSYAKSCKILHLDLGDSTYDATFIFTK